MADLIYMNSSRRHLAIVIFTIFMVLVGAKIDWAGHGIEDLVNSVPADRVKNLLDAGEKVILIDLRPEKDFQEKRLPGARSLPLAEFDKRDNEVPRSGRVILYCDCLLYQLVEKATRLDSQGYRNVGVMLEGFTGWAKLGYPLEIGRK